MISFDGEYYKYHSGEKEEQGLAIGRDELDFLSGLVVSYLFFKGKTLLNPKTYPGIYPDDSLVVF